MNAARFSLRAGAALVVLATGAVGLASPALAWTKDQYSEWSSSTQPPQELPPLTQQMLDFSIETYSLSDGVKELETTETSGGETTISLSADIMFEPDAWDVPENAATRIRDLLADVPEGAAVAVSGHTDSVIGAVDNQVLSDNRAQAVATVISAARPDLVLTVAGYANTQPAVAEDPDDPATYATNRRVEITYNN